MKTLIKSILLIIFMFTANMSQSQTRIMPFGDSITELDWEGGYRSFLYKMLTDSGYNFKYVGRNTTNHEDRDILGFPFPSPYWNHEGWSNRTIFNNGPNSWLPDIGNAMKLNIPDIALVLVGTNDIANGTRSATQIRNDLSSLLDSLWKYNPSMRVVLSNIPRIPGTANNIVLQVNALLPALVQQKISSGKYIVLVDMYNILTEDTDFADGIHPSVQGYHKMARAWYFALKELLHMSLPVELVSFTANTNSGNVHLNWRTATETNNYGFEIERFDGSWNKIGFLIGAGNSNSPKSYTFVDRDANYSAMYRLKQLDRDGTFTYSNTLNVKILTPLAFELRQNYPNPFNPTTTIAFTLPVDAYVVLEIFDLDGKLVMTSISQTMYAGHHSRVINMDYLSSGTYFYRLRAGVFTSIKKFTLMK